MECISRGKGMTDKKQIRGLLNYISLKPGEEFEFAPNSEDYVSGMGFGATKQAIRWAYKGFLLESRERLESITHKTNGRPRKSFFLKKDTVRVFVLWFMVKDWPQSKRAKITNRDLISLAQKVSYSNTTQELFDESMSANIEQSVSRGRTALKIDKNWDSEVCEKQYKNLSQTT